MYGLDQGDPMLKWLLVLGVMLGGCIALTACTSSGQRPLPQAMVAAAPLREGPPVPVALAPGDRVSDVVIDPVRIRPETAPGYEDLPTSVTSVYSVPPLKLSLGEVVTETLANNLAIKAQGYSLRIAEYGVPAARGIYDLLFTSRLRYIRTEEQEFTTSTIPLIGRDRQRTGELGLSQLLPTGAILQPDYLVTRSPNGIERHIASLNLTQPLLSGFGPTVTNANIQFARLERTASAGDYQALVEDQLVDSLTTYWDLVGTLEFYKVKVVSYAAALDLLRINREKVRVELLPNADEYQAEAAAEDRRSQLILARQAVRDLEDRLTRLIFLRPDRPLWTAEIEPTQPVAWRELRIGLDDALAVAQDCRPELQRAASAVEEARLNLKVARNTVLPQLDFFGTLSSNGLGEGFDEGVRASRSGKFTSYVTGLSFSFPLQNRAARYRARQAQAALQQAEEQAKDLRNQITLEVRQALRDLQTARLQIDVTRSQVDSQEANLIVAQQRYDVGLMTTFEVLSFQEDLANAQSEHLRAIVAANQAAIRLERARGTLLATYGVQMTGADLGPACAALDAPR
jgi:outer membrane protein TolC